MSHSSSQSAAPDSAQRVITFVEDVLGLDMCDWQKRMMTAVFARRRRGVETLTLPTSGVLTDLMKSARGREPETVTIQTAAGPRLVPAYPVSGPATPPRPRRNNRARMRGGDCSGQ